MKAMYEDFFPQRLAKLSSQKGVSARDMSLPLGQANNYINNIDNKKSLPAMQSFFYICEYPDVMPQEFFDKGNPCPEVYRRGKETGSQVDGLSSRHYEGTEQQEVKRPHKMGCFFLIISYTALSVNTLFRK